MMTNKTDYYYILQVSPKATSEDIKMSFRRLARQYHPDLNPNNPETAEHFKKISEAYDTLSDETKRRRYDRDRNLENLQNPKSYRSRNSTRRDRSEPSSGVSQARDFFLRGMAKSQNKQYQTAVIEYSKAIELDPTFVDAYLKRCEMRYKLGDNQGVLDDCYRVIKISPSVPKAYYYQGRARFSLGYVQAAIDSYSEAIRQEKNYAQAYYYRGIAYQDLKDRVLALEDWQVAADLFHSEGNHGASRLTRKKINSLNRENFDLGFAFSSIIDLLNNAITTLIAYIFNPVSGLLPAFTRLSTFQALGIGLIYGFGADLCLTASSYLLIGSSRNFLPDTSYFNFEQLLLLNFLPFIALSITSNLVRLINKIQGSLAQDIFLAGTSLLPLGLSLLAIGFIATRQGVPTLPLLTLLIFGFSYGMLTLYANCTQIIRLSEAKSVFLVPLMTSITLCFHYLARNLFI